MRKVQTSARRRWRMRSVVALTMTGAVVTSMGLAIVSVSAVADETQTVHKSYVCKYVGQPGVDERLQDGGNPIWVDNNALLGPHSETAETFVGQEFSDAHALSLVIVANTPQLDPEPSVAACPDYIPVPATPSTSDPCNLPGVASNIAFVVPNDTDQLDWTLLSNGNLTVQPKAGYRFPGGNEVQVITFTLPQDNGELCQTPPPPPTKDPVTVPVTQQQSSCERGLEERTGSQTTSYTWNPTRAAFDEQVGAVSWGSWTFVRDLSDAEFEALGCRPDQPEPKVVALADERMDCDIDVQAREGTQTTSYVWNAETRAFDEVVGPDVWGDWVKIRKLSAAEAIDLDCIAGEETVIPKPKPKPDREPVVLGTEAAVPTAVAAGLAGDSGSTSIQLVGQSLAGMGLLTMVAAGWLGLSRRTRGAHLG